jgi:hypothetical protein
MGDELTHENYDRTIEELLTEIYFIAFSAPEHMQRAWTIIYSGLEEELDQESRERAFEYALVRYSASTHKTA